MENWIDIGSADELSATPLKRVTAMNRELAVSYKDAKFGVPRAITQADHWVRAGSMASTLSVPGITGNFIDAAARANPGSRRTVFRPTRSKSKTVEC